MPLFEYECQECGVKFEELRISGEGNDEVRCPQCSAVNIVKLFSSFSSGSSSNTNNTTNCSSSAFT